MSKIVSKFFTLIDGSIMFVKRGLPPMEMPGYEKDDKDDYLFHPILPPCTARIFKTMVQAKCCPVERNLRHCTKYGFYAMTPEQCNTCVSQGLHDPIQVGTDKL